MTKWLAIPGSPDEAPTISGDPFRRPARPLITLREAIIGCKLLFSVPCNHLLNPGEFRDPVWGGAAMTAVEVARTWRQNSGIRDGYVIVHAGNHSCLWRETLNDGEIVEITRQDLFCSRKVVQYFAFDANDSAFMINYDPDNAVYFWNRS